MNDTNAPVADGTMVDSDLGLTVFEPSDETVPTADGVVDGSPDNTEESTTAPTDNGEELFDLEAGKNPDGTPNIVKMTKAELLKFAGIGRTSAQKINEVRTQQEQLTALAKALQDPEKFWEIASKLGHDQEAMVNAIVEQRIAESLEDPEARQRRVEKAELERYRAQEAAAKKEAEEKAAAELAQGFTQRLDAKLTEVLSAAKLPNNPANRSELARYLKTLMFDEQGNMRYQRPLVEIPLQKLVDYMKSSRVTGLQAMLDGADEDAILETLPQELQDRIAKAVSKRMQNAGKQSAAAPSNKINNQPAKKDDNGQRKVKTVEEREEEIARTVAAAQRAWELRNGKRKA